MPLTLAALRGLRAGAVCAAFANRPQGSFIDETAKRQVEDDLIEVGLGALHKLAAMRAQRGPAAHWHPGLSA